MPLAFDSVSHGTVAFGFFNIDSDMLLLEHYFFFATDFCAYVSEIAEACVEGSFEGVWHVYYIADQREIGDLMGAIYAINHTGFIGEVYRRFPFPKNPENFKQKPDGIKSQGLVKSVITEYGKLIEIPFTVDEEQGEVAIGEYRFRRSPFQELVKYVWRGGYPRWKNETRPSYVLAMRKEIERCCNRLFHGIIFEE
ncbi:MAG TPA: hypothetical protein VMW90_08870 [Acidobacteriota bacterium]|nr:hypothetical protein [Acidobacteriota bacterium]